MSKYKISEEMFEKTFNLFIEVIAHSMSKSHIHAILFDILSPVERLMIAKRIMIMYLVRRGVDYMVISEALKVSSTTIAKYTYLLERSTGIKHTLDIVMKDSNFKLFFKELLVILYHPGGYKLNWKAAAKLQQAIQKQKELGI